MPDNDSRAVSWRRGKIGVALLLLPIFPLALMRGYQTDQITEAIDGSLISYGVMYLVIVGIGWRLHFPEQPLFQFTQRMVESRRRRAIVITIVGALVIAQVVAYWIPLFMPVGLVSAFIIWRVLERRWGSADHSLSG